jgi:hypothetical protein
MGSVYHKKTTSTLMKLLSSVPLLAILAGCGDPAPGEGVDSPLGEGPEPEVVSAAQALQTPNISTLDPATLQDSDISKVIPAGPMCTFTYSADGGPIMAASRGQSGDAVGVVKLHGRLVRLTKPGLSSYDALMNGGIFSAGDVSFEVTPEEQESGRRPAEAHFSVRGQITVGYRGWYSCSRSS